MASIYEIYNLFSKSFGISTDSRNITPGSLFFGLKGSNFDGNSYALESIKKGALYAIIDNAKYKNNNPNIIVVKNSLKTLQDLAKLHRQKLKTIKIIAIAGSNGKTTTQNLISSILKTQYHILSTPKNWNNEIGVPLTLLQLKPHHNIAIIEIGANHLNEHTFLCNIINPDYGLITSFGKDHLEGYGSIENAINSNLELYNYLHKNNNPCFVNLTDSIQNKHKKSNDIGFGIENSICHGKILSFFPFKGVFYTKNDTIKITSNLFGSFQINNILCSISIGLYFKIKPENIKKAIEQYIPKNNRSQIIKWNSNTLLLDAYNANPTSMELMIKDFEKHDNSIKKGLIIGEMGELGKESEKEHQNIISLINNCKSFNFVIMVGDAFRNLTVTFENAMWFHKTKEVQNFIKSNLLENFFILVKGSRSMRLESIFE